MSSIEERDKYIANRLIKVAKDYAKEVYCPRCKKKGMTVVSLNELPTIIPTEIAVFCKTCGYSDSLARIDKEFEKHLQSICDKLSQAVKRSSGEEVTESGIIIPKSKK